MTRRAAPVRAKDPRVEQARLLSHVKYIGPFRYLDQALGPDQRGCRGRDG